MTDKKPLRKKGAELISFLKKLPNLLKAKKLFSVPGGKWPKWKQFKHLPKIMPSRERWTARGLLLAILISTGTLIFGIYADKTLLIPEIGGQYKEGILGQPRFINPVLSPANDADRDLTQLVYSSLFKYNSKGELIPDLVEEYNIEEDNTTYNIFLKKGIVWHDDEPLTANDVIFTIKTIQDPEYKSPLKNNWQGVQVEKIDEFSIRIKLNNVYAPFLHNLTIGILPKHLWGGMSASNFQLAQYNLKPIGSGPYKFKKFSKTEEGQIESMEFTRNKSYYLNGPFIEKITVRFYNNQNSLIEAYKKRQIQGLSILSPSNQPIIKKSFNIHEIQLPIYYAVFFNQTQSKALSDKNVRLALAYATNKDEIVEKALNNKGQKTDSPLLPGWLGYTSETKVYNFDLEYAKRILEENNWKDSDEDNVLEKTISDEEVRLEINILTTDWPELSKTAEILKEQWEKLGAIVNLEIVDSSDIQQEFIRPRNYESLLFGEVLNADPDPFAFWHSSQKKDPGLNLALYQNKDVDKLLEDARQEIDQEKRIEKYAEFQKQIIEDIPAIFLYSPTYLYPVSKKIRGIDIEKFAQPSYRFSQVENWHIKTDRVWK